MKVAVLSILLALPARPETTDGGCEGLYGDAPLAVAMDGGAFVPQKRLELTACRLASCETERDRLRTEPPQSEGPSGLKALIVAGPILFILGLVIGLASK